LKGYPEKKKFRRGGKSGGAAKKRKGEEGVLGNGSEEA